MILLIALVALAQDDGARIASTPAACDPSAAIAGVREGQQDAYVCTITHDSGHAALIAALNAGGENPERLTRALALHLLLRADAPFDAADVRRLSAADRRLLADGIRARRGRASPVKAHAEVFARWDWYRPVATYSDGRLNAVDLANIALADKPPDAVPTAPMQVAAAEAPVSTGLFGCASAPGAVPAWIVGLGGVSALLRRRAQRSH